MAGGIKPLTSLIARRGGKAVVPLTPFSPTGSIAHVRRDDFRSARGLVVASPAPRLPSRKAYTSRARMDNTSEITAAKRGLEIALAHCTTLIDDRTAAAIAYSAYVETLKRADPSEAKFHGSYIDIKASLDKELQAYIRELQEASKITVGQLEKSLGIINKVIRKIRHQVGGGDEVLPLYEFICSQLEKTKLQDIFKFCDDLFGRMESFGELANIATNWLSVTGFLLRTYNQDLLLVSPLAAKLLLLNQISVIHADIALTPEEKTSEINNSILSVLKNCTTNTEAQEFLGQIPEEVLAAYPFSLEMELRSRFLRIKDSPAEELEALILAALAIPFTLDENTVGTLFNFMGNLKEAAISFSASAIAEITEKAFAVINTGRLDFESALTCYYELKKLIGQNPAPYLTDCLEQKLLQTLEPSTLNEAWKCYNDFQKVTPPCPFSDALGKKLLQLHQWNEFVSEFEEHFKRLKARDTEGRMVTQLIIDKLKQAKGFKDLKKVIDIKNFGVHKAAFDSAVLNTRFAQMMLKLNYFLFKDEIPRNSLTAIWLQYAQSTRDVNKRYLGHQIFLALTLPPQEGETLRSRIEYLKEDFKELLKYSLKKGRNNLFSKLFKQTEDFAAVAVEAPVSGAPSSALLLAVHSGISAGAGTTRLTETRLFSDEGSDGESEPEHTRGY